MKFCDCQQVKERSEERSPEKRFGSADWLLKLRYAVPTVVDFCIFVRLKTNGKNESVKCQQFQILNRHRRSFFLFKLCSVIVARQCEAIVATVFSTCTK
jgi:hypothetical protein